MFSTLLVTTLLVGASIAQNDNANANANAQGNNGLGLCRPFADIEAGEKLFEKRGKGVCGAGRIRRVARRRLAVGLSKAADDLEGRLEALKTEAEARRTRLRDAAAAARSKAETARADARAKAEAELMKAENAGDKKRQTDREQWRARVEAVTQRLRAAIMACNEKPAGERRACYAAARAASEDALKAATEAARAAVEERRVELIDQAEAARADAIAKAKARLDELKGDAKACGDALKANDELKAAIAAYKEARKAKPCADAIAAFRDCPRETDAERAACRETARATACFADVVAAGKEVRALAKAAFDDEVCADFKPKVRCLKLAKRRCFAIEGTDSECTAGVSAVDAETELDFVRAKAAERFATLCGDDCKATQVTRLCHGGVRETGETEELTGEKRCRRFVCAERSVPDESEESDERKRDVSSEFDTVFSASNFDGAADETVEADGAAAVDVFLMDDDALAFDDGETYDDAAAPTTTDTASATSYAVSAVAVVVAMLANF